MFSGKKWTNGNDDIMLKSNWKTLRKNLYTGLEITKSSTNFFIMANST